MTRSGALSSGPCWQVDIRDLDNNDAIALFVLKLAGMLVEYGCPTHRYSIHYAVTGPAPPHCPGVV
jgi:hypothetical protein